MRRGAEPADSRDRSQTRNQRILSRPSCRTAYLCHCHWIRIRFGKKVFKFNNEASDVYRQCLWSGCGVSFTARGSEWISAVPSSRRGATIPKASSSFFNLAGSISFDPNAANLARISLLLLMLGTSLKESFSHLSVAL